ncbi:MAG: ArsR family transcriptional regulator [Hyphomicrobiales bacterium]|nr:MAG: ArsR family transcriptional regulator [Hyphomicrobiales bacterium]
MNFDQADRVLLENLQTDSSRGLEYLSQACGLSIASVQRRLKRMRESGVIQREVAILDRKMLGQAMTFIVMVEMERERLDDLDKFHRIACGDPQVQQCYYVTGEADFTLICTARDMEDFEALTHRLFFDNKNVRRFWTSVVMGIRKLGLSVPVDEAI